MSPKGKVSPRLHRHSFRLWKCKKTCQSHDKCFLKRKARIVRNTLAQIFYNPEEVESQQGEEEIKEEDEEEEEEKMEKKEDNTGEVVEEQENEEEV